MKYKNYRKFLAVGLSLAGLFFSTQTFAAGCYDPGVEDTYVTQYGGSDISCPAEYTECVVTFKNGNVTSESGDCATLGITANVDVNTNGILWGSDDSINPYGIDSEMTNSAQGGKGCLYVHGTDKFAGVIGYATNPASDADFFPATKAVFCSDNVEEVAFVEEPDPVVTNCTVPEVGGGSLIIHGVQFTCPEVPPGETRTIIIVKDDETFVDDQTGLSTLRPAPGFGFVEEGTTNIDFNNVCECKGPPLIGGSLPVEKPACDPDPANETGGCEVVDAEVPVNIEIQNPKCFTVGGFRRCY